MDLNPTILGAQNASREAIEALDAALVALFTDPDHLAILAQEQRLQGEPLAVDGVPFVPTPEEPTE